MKKVKFLLATMVFGALAFGFNACSNTDEPTPTDDPSVVVTGDGTETSPYSVTQSISNQGSSKWVQGFIVGYIKTSGEQNEWIFSADGCDNETNLILASSATETNQGNCIAVQLVAGAIRTGLNLVANPNVLGKEVLMYGSLEAYFTAPGLKAVSYAKLIEAGTEFGSKPVDVTDAILNETLLTQESYDKFSSYNVLGEQVWNFSTSNYGAVMSGYANSVSNANEDWFISPAMDLTGKTAALTFEHARGPAGSMNVSTSNYTLWYSTNYSSGAPSTAEWATLVIPTHGTTAWGYVSSGSINLPAAANVRFAFKYVCDNTESATWEIKNVVVK